MKQNKDHLLDALKTACVVAIIRAKESSHVIQAADALEKGGVRCIEVTMNTPGALDHIRELSAHNKEGMFFGAGTVTSKEAAVQSIKAGAQFVVTPYTRRDVIDVARDHDIPVFSGALTPGEVAQAWEWGADVVKVFPAEMFGPAYIKALLAPLNHIPLMPTGGVTPENAADWLKAGAYMLGVGSALYNASVAAEGRFDKITENAQRLMAEVRKVRPDVK